MTEKETQHLASAVAQAVNSAKPLQSENSKMMDVIWKLASAAAMAMLTWTVNSVGDLKQDVGDLKKDKEYNTESMREIKEFTQKPRFTLEDFQSGLVPLSNKVNSNTVELNSRNSFMDKSESADQKTINEITILKNRVDNLEDRVRKFNE